MEMSNMEIINFSADLEASESRRIIAGKIVPFGDEIGNTNAGKVVFEANSIQIDDPKNVKPWFDNRRTSNGNGGT